MDRSVGKRGDRISSRKVDSMTFSVGDKVWCAGEAWIPFIGVVEEVIPAGPKQCFDLLKIRNLDGKLWSGRQFECIAISDYLKRREAEIHSLQVETDEIRKWAE